MALTLKILGLSPDLCTLVVGRYETVLPKQVLNAFNINNNINKTAIKTKCADTFA